MDDCKFVLASASPRRKDILTQVGIEFDIWPSNAPEEKVGNLPEDICMHIAHIKASDVASSIKAYANEHNELVTPNDIVVIGADTIVVCNNKILGKPKDEQEAKDMLLMLSGNTHEVYTGVCLIFMLKNGRVGEYTFYERTYVTFECLTDKDIEEYIATGSCMDKAGAYGIQDMSAKFISGINGDYYNVMGLPVSRLVHELRKLGVDV